MPALHLYRHSWLLGRRAEHQLGKQIGAMVGLSLATIRLGKQIEAMVGLSLATIQRRRAQAGKVELSRSEAGVRTIWTFERYP